ncbi:NAD(P)/FAD-dependent oxidoreductase [Paenibacillus athensensis]|uniref:Pyridine nucleotide-disulfide oxidoreductase n=1 Tax=Paenibacillus athensensis TaxID=1967502 RepID=A0A4Y8QAK3_9BACL|nr:NAD(P)/FAD-dependent oxidoreductase [Paenibacillus athensensis]MCD1258983.1 NAD(P)/FAD-dependent oxidoreductase [Paenibacillus athensensis]
MTEQLVDVAIVGGGPAGLSAALVLGRARKRVAMVDEARPRNAVTHAVHGFLTRDGVSPAEFRRLAHEELAAYPSVSLTEDTVVSVQGADGRFELTTARGSKLISRKILFATGMKDKPLRIPGLAETYGTSAFVCPYCDGWELRDQRLVVIQQGAELLHFAPLIAGWTSDFVVCTNGPDGLSEEQRAELREHRVVWHESPIRRIESADGIVRQVVLEDGTALACRGIFFKPELVCGSELPAALGCRLTEAGAVVVDEFGKTNVPGVYSAGDAASRMYQAVAAAAMGAFAAAAMNNEMNLEAWVNRK